MFETPQSSLDVGLWLRNDCARPTKIVRPKQVGCWTKESARAASQAGEYLYGSRDGLMHYFRPQLPQDLNQGYPEAFERKPEDEDTVETIIRGALHASTNQQHSSPSASSVLQGAQVVTYRNNLNKIYGTPLDPNDGWVVEACMHNGTLFLEKSKSEPASYPDADRFIYYGYKFESLCTMPPTQHDEGESLATGLPSSGGHPIVDATSEFAVLLKVKLGQHSVLMAAEIDCVDPSVVSTGHPAQGTPVGPSYIELKTYKIPGHPGQWRTLYAQKYPRWWLQSFLAGVPELVLGGRDQNGSLKEVQRISVQSLPSSAEKAGHKWDAWRMLRFGEDVLSWMRTVGRSHHGQALRFEYVPQKRCIGYSVMQGGSLPQRLHHILP